MRDNIIAAMIFIIAIAGLIALVVYKMRKDNNKVTIEDFLDIYRINLFNVIQDVVNLLSINVEEFETKEEYERTIISVTISKLEENCDEFGISSALFKLIDKDVLTNALYDILYTNKVQIFFSTLPEKIIKIKPELYDKEVIEAFENAQSVIGEDEETPNEIKEESYIEEENTEQKEEDTDVSYDEKNEEIEEEVHTEASTVNNENAEETDNNITTSEVSIEENIEESTTNGLPPREVYYGTPKEKLSTEFSVEDAVFEVHDSNIDYRFYN